LRARDHRWREVDADQMRRKGPKGRSNKPSAAAEIEQRLKSHRPSETAQDGIHRVAKDCRAAIMQLLGQGRVVARGVLVEEPAQVGLAHRRSAFAGAKPRELQARAVIIFGVRAARLGKGRDGAWTVAETAAECAKRKPRCREVRRDHDGLRQEVRRGGQIPAHSEIHRRVKAAIGDEIAGRYKERAGLGH
jgi:hypothetical protein